MAARVGQLETASEGTPALAWVALFSTLYRHAPAVELPVPTPPRRFRGILQTFVTLAASQLVIRRLART